MTACPRCSAAVTQKTYAGVDLAECSRCQGLFASPAVVASLAESTELRGALHAAIPSLSPQRDPGAKYLHCPSCDKLMNRKVFGRVSGIIVDVCRDHGVWFDGGELGAVLDFIDRGGLAKAKRRDEEDRVEAQHAQKAALVRERLREAMETSPRHRGFGDDRPIRAQRVLDFVEDLYLIFG